MLSASFAEPLGIWAANRMQPAVFAGAAAVILAGAAVGGTPTAGWALGAIPAALLLLFQFRLWDDLADAPRDRIEHPERYLPRCPSTAVFRAAVWIAAVVNLTVLVLFTGLGAALGFVVLNVLFFMWYRLSPKRRTGVPGTLALLLKYPAFSALLAPPPLDPATLAAACAAVYLAICCYEFWRPSA